MVGNLHLYAIIGEHAFGILTVRKSMFRITVKDVVSNFCMTEREEGVNLGPICARLSLINTKHF